MTLPDSLWPIALVSATDTVTPRGTGLNERFSAEARSESRSFPPSSTILFASSSVAHIFAATRGAPSSGSSNCSPAQDAWMTCQP